MKSEAGKRYVNAHGEIIGPMQRDGDFWHYGVRMWTLDGKGLLTSSDLLYEYAPPVGEAG